MAKFKVGDRVRIRQWADMEKEFGVNLINDIKCKFTFTPSMRDLCGRTATVIYVSKDGGVELDFDDKSCTMCWSYSTDMIEPIKTEQETIVIYRNGDTVTALDKRDGRKATAKCSPDDTFDFAVGARLAFDRLMGETKQEKPKEAYYNGKAVCVKPVSIPHTGFTVGKVYTFIEGETTDDDGSKRPRGYKIRTLEEYEKRSGAIRFIEYKGGAE